MRAAVALCFGLALIASAAAQNAEDAVFCRDIAKNGKLSFGDCMTMMGVSRYNAGEQTTLPGPTVARPPTPAPSGPTNCVVIPLGGGMTSVSCN